MITPIGKLGEVNRNGRKYSYNTFATNLNNAIKHLPKPTFMEDKDMQVHIISGFPGIGKSTAFDKLNKSPICLGKMKIQDFKIIDLDSAVFKENIMDKDSVQMWYVQYAIFIRNLKLMYEANCAPTDCRHIFILISSHKEVRQSLDMMGIKFTYVVPTIEREEEFVKMLKERADAAKGSNRAAAMRAFVFMKSNFRKSVQEAIDTKKELPNQMLIELPPKAFLLDMILDRSVN